MSIQSHIYNLKLKEIKHELGSKCRHLATLISTKGERWIRVILDTSDGKKEYKFSFPIDLEEVTRADYERLEELIREKMV